MPDRSEERVAVNARQLELLAELAGAQWGSLHLRGNWLLTGRSLERRGLAERVGYGVRDFAITESGRAALDQDRAER